MTTPQDPYGSSGGSSDQPGYGQPGQGQQGGQPGYGQQGDFGSPPPGWGQPPAKQGTNGMAIASLIMAFLIGLVGVILGFIAKSQIKRTGQSGNGLATAGIIIGFLNMAFGILLFAGGLAATSP